MSPRPLVSRHRLFPFSIAQVELALALCGCVVGTLAYAGVQGQLLAVAVPAILLAAYVVGLVAHLLAQSERQLCFVMDGALGGLGYERFFREAKKSLLLMHVDDDEPSEELRLLYTRLLERGVQVRRTVFYRQTSRHAAYSWIARSGSHPNLKHRIIDGPASSVMPLSFAVVDEAVLLIAVPGFHVVDTEPLAGSLVFRHLLALRNQNAIRGFLEMYEKLWGIAQPVEPTDLLGRS